MPCGINDKEIINLKYIKDQKYYFFDKKIIKNFVKYLKI